MAVDVEMLNGLTFGVERCIIGGKDVMQVTCNVGPIGETSMVIGMTERAAVVGGDYSGAAGAAVSVCLSRLAERGVQIAPTMPSALPVWG